MIQNSFWSLGQIVCTFSLLIATRAEALDTTATLASADLDAPYVLTGAWVKSTSNVTYFRARSVHFALSKDGQAIELVDSEASGLGTLYSFSIKKHEGDQYVIDFVGGFNQIYFQSPLNYPEQAIAQPKKFALSLIPLSAKLPRDFQQNGKSLALDLHNLPYKTSVPSLLSQEPKCEPFVKDVCELKAAYKFTDVPIETEVHIRLAPQKASTAFDMKIDTVAKGVGYFATFPDAEGLSYITKRPTAEPMIWYVSTPESIRAALLEALSYWNQILGSEFLQVREMPAGFDIWQPYVNSIIFYENDPAGGAAGVFSTLPTGEIVTGHIYVPAGFLGFAQSLFDYYVPALKAKGLSDEKITEARARLVHDYTVQTFAHEVGHSLGLRHNFKGSRVSHIRNLHASIWNYLITDEIKADESPSSSLMDYMGFDYFTLMGAKIRKNFAGTLAAPPLRYDSYAIHWGYSRTSDPVDPSAAGPYCDLPEDLAQDAYHSPTDRTCASWDQPERFRILRLDLGTQKAVLVGTKAEILNQCRSEAWSESILKAEKPKFIGLTVPAGGLRLGHSKGQAITSPTVACKIVEAYLDKK